MKKTRLRAKYLVQGQDMLGVGDKFQQSDSAASVLTYYMCLPPPPHILRTANSALTLAQTRESSLLVLKMLPALHGWCLGLHH